MERAGIKRLNKKSGRFRPSGAAADRRIPGRLRSGPRSRLDDPTGSAVPTGPVAGRWAGQGLAGRTGPDSERTWTEHGSKMDRTWK